MCGRQCRQWPAVNLLTLSHRVTQPKKGGQDSHSRPAFLFAKNAKPSLASKLRRRKEVGKALKCALSQTRLPATTDDFLYPLHSIRHPLLGFHPTPYGDDDGDASHNHCYVYQKGNGSEYSHYFHRKLNLLNVSLHSSFSSEWNRLMNPPQRFFLPFMPQKAPKFRVGRASATIFGISAISPLF